MARILDGLPGDNDGPTDIDPADCEGDDGADEERGSGTGTSASLQAPRVGLSELIERRLRSDGGSRRSPPVNQNDSDQSEEKESETDANVLTGPRAPEKEFYSTGAGP